LEKKKHWLHWYVYTFQGPNDVEIMSYFAHQCNYILEIILRKKIQIQILFSKFLKQKIKIKIVVMTTNGT
jgi:hypothetical protein